MLTCPYLDSAHFANMYLLDTLASWNAVTKAQPILLLGHLIILIDISLFLLISVALTRQLAPTNQKASGLWVCILNYGLNTMVWTIASWATPTRYMQPSMLTFSGRDIFHVSLMKKIQLCFQKTYIGD